MVMRKLGRSPTILEPLEMFRRLDEPTRSRIDDHDRVEAVMVRATEGLRTALSTPSIVHGWRAQSMFESLVVALDGCQLLMTIDHGQVFHDGDPVKPADLLLVLRDGRRLLVDVKGLPPGKVRGHVGVSAHEWRGLRRFGDLLGAEVYLAYLVPAAPMWALVPMTLLPEPVGEARTQVAVTDLLVANELQVLGDLLLGVEPPLRMDLVADTSSPRPVRIEAEDLADTEFTIGTVEFSAGGRRLMGTAEQRLAYFMIMFGPWPVDNRAVAEGGQLERLVFDAHPAEPTPGQNFQMVDYLSSMYTRWFDLATRDRDGHVEAFDTAVEPGMLPALVPHDWQSDELHLWRFHMSPGGRPPGTGLRDDG